ncbi:hypothetical protein TNCV_4151441 [Trichonephila clavipes]|nr:hypothetical protein TNCV_4151441 [Trichonephila clavipes]
MHVKSVVAQKSSRWCGVKHFDGKLPLHITADRRNYQDDDRQTQGPEFTFFKGKLKTSNTTGHNLQETTFTLGETQTYEKWNRRHHTHRGAISSYKKKEFETPCVLIQDQLKLQERCEREIQRLVSELSSLPPCDTPNCTLHTSPNNSPVKINPQEFPLFPSQRRQNVKIILTVLPPPPPPHTQRKISKNSRSNSTSELNFNIELANKFNSLDNLNIQSQPIADTTKLPHHSNFATTKSTVNPIPKTVNLPPPTMLKITDDLRNQMKILTTKMPYLRNKKAGQHIKLYMDTFKQHDALNAFLDNVKFPHYTITPKTQRPIKVVIKGLPRDAKPSDISNDLIDLGFTFNLVETKQSVSDASVCCRSQYESFPDWIVKSISRKKTFHVPPLVGSMGLHYSTQDKVDLFADSLESSFQENPEPYDDDFIDHVEE